MVGRWNSTATPIVGFCHTSSLSDSLFSLLSHLATFSSWQHVEKTYQERENVYLGDALNLGLSCAYSVRCAFSIAPVSIGQFTHNAQRTRTTHNADMECNLLYHIESDFWRTTHTDNAQRTTRLWMPSLIQCGVLSMYSSFKTYSIGKN